MATNPLRHTTRLATLAVAFAAPLTAQGMTWTSLPGNALGIPVGDVTGDGIDDLLTTYQVSATGWNYRVFDATTGTELAFLQRPAGSPPFAYPNYRAIGDHDGDGREDLAYTDASTTTCTVVSGTNGSTLLSLTSGGGVLAGGGADFDGDGVPDLMYTENSAAKIRSGRTGAILFQQNPIVGVYHTFRIAPAGDVNGDGYEDAVTFGYGQVSVPMYVVAGPAGTLLGPWFNANVVGDVTGDGKVDVFTAPPGSPAPAPTILAGGSFTVAWTLPTALAAVGMGDVDGDGIGDVGTRAGITFEALSGATHAPLPGVAMNAEVGRLGDIDGDGRSECAMAGARFEWSDPTVPIASRKLRRGVASTTSSGRRPTMATRGHCGLGGTVFFDLRGNEPNGLVLLVYGSIASVELTPLGAPNNFSLTTVDGAFGFVADGNGVAQFAATLPTSPTLLGTGLSLQSVAADPAANAFGLVTSHAVDVETHN